MQEEWVPVVGFEHYLVSNTGKIRHYDSNRDRKGRVSDRGNLVLTLYGKDSMTRYMRNVNKLVAEAFLPKPQFAVDKHVINIDGDPENCHVDNLRWASFGEVKEWNAMHQTGEPAYTTPRVRNNETGRIYVNAYECAMDERKLESTIVKLAEAYHYSDYRSEARYEYLED